MRTIIIQYKKRMLCSDVDKSLLEKFRQKVEFLPSKQYWLALFIHIIQINWFKLAFKEKKCRNSTYFLDKKKNHLDVIMMFLKSSLWEDLTELLYWYKWPVFLLIKRQKGSALYCKHFIWNYLLFSKYV